MLFLPMIPTNDFQFLCVYIKLIKRMQKRNTSNQHNYMLSRRVNRPYNRSPPLFLEFPDDGFKTPSPTSLLPQVL